MRIVGFFAKFTVLLLLLVTGVFLVSREALLLIASREVKSALSDLVLISHKGSYASNCRAKGVTDFSSGAGPELQLRFISDTEFVLEVNCIQNSLEPILISQEVLPPFVTKKQGGSGFTLREVQSAVELEVFRDVEAFVSEWLFFEPTFITRSTTIAASGGTVVDAVSVYDYDSGPVTSCSGYGYFCCNGVDEKGVGDTITGLTGCEKSCYSQCVSRPVVLSFTTSPFYEFTTRTVTIRKGETVEFSYVTDPGKGNSVTATLTFGDGATETLQSDSSQTMHRYSCNQAKCTYTASLKLTDNWGVESAETDVSKVTIIVE